MRVLFTMLPGAGPFHPLVPPARALEEVGHEVAFAASRSYCPTVEGTGFRCFPAGYDWRVAEREPLYGRLWRPAGSGWSRKGRHKCLRSLALQLSAS